MRLLLVRHGEAKTEAEDPERSLTERGAADAEKIAGWASRAGVQATEIRHSGKRRAEQTATILGARLDPPNGVTAVSGLKPNDDVWPIAEELKTQGDPLMLVGHLPFLSRLASMLLVGDPDAAVIHFPTAGIVCLRRGEGEWSVSWVVTPDLVES